MSKTTILNEHLEFKKTSVHSPDKIKDIKRYLQKFLNSNKKPLSKFNEQDIAKFINSLNYSVRTTNDIKTYIKVFVKWYYPDYSARFRNLDILCKMQKPSKAFQPEDMLSLKEIQKLIKAEKELMYKCYWAIFFYGGFRPSEACNLKWSDVFFENEGVIIKLHTTKTKKDFYKSLPKEAQHLLKEWKRYNQSEWVFPSTINENQPIKARSIRGRLVKLSQKILNKKVVPYQLRHSVAKILYLDKEKKDDDVAKQLGHNKSMKETYLQLSGDDEKLIARTIWSNAKDLPPEKKHQLEKEIEELKANIKKEKAELIKEFSDRMKKIVEEIYKPTKDKITLNELLTSLA